MPHAPDDAFLQLVEPHRRALRLHCYRMLGSARDSDDVMQETLVRAWRARHALDAPSRVRPWLYRIATNVCLDELKHRKDRPLPYDVVDPGDPSIDPVPPGPDASWLEPCPDGWLVGATPDPGAAYELKESVALAFVAALQCLSAVQRAALLLRDVVGMSAEQTASALGMTIAASESALHRARSAARTKVTSDSQARRSSELDDQLLRRYLEAWQDKDIDAFVALLHDDVVLTMPPSPTWLRGKPAIATFFAGHAFAERRSVRFVPTGANGQPALGCYVGGALTAIHVVRIQRGLVADMHHFMSPECLGLFGLPDAWSPAST